MKKIVVINGTGGSGKDTVTELAAKKYKVYNVSSVDKVKEIAKSCGWSGEKGEKDRKFLSDLKQLLINYNDFPFTDICEKIQMFKNSDNDIMFVHIREPKEIQKIVDKVGAITLLIKRKGLENIKSNDSDLYVDNYNYDYCINNDGSLDELEEKVEEFITEISEE